MNTAISIVRRLCLAAAALSGVAIVALMLHVSADVAMRTFMNRPILGTLEIVAYWWMVSIAFLGIAYTKIRNEHIAVDLLPDRLPIRQRAVVRLILEVITIAVLLLLVFYGWEAAMSSMARGENAVGVTPIPVWPFRFLLPLGGLLMVAACVAAVLENIGTIAKRQGEHA